MYHCSILHLFTPTNNEWLRARSSFHEMERQRRNTIAVWHFEIKPAILLSKRDWMHCEAPQTDSARLATTAAALVARLPRSPHPHMRTFDWRRWRRRRRLSHFRSLPPRFPSAPMQLASKVVDNRYMFAPRQSHLYTVHSDVAFYRKGIA